MITGKVTGELEGTIELEVNGSVPPPQLVEAVIDTGFNGYLTLPNHLIGLLNLLPAGNRGAILGDGSAVILDAFLATVPRHGRDRDVLVLGAEGGAVVGMSLLYGSRLSMEVVVDGDVAIEELAPSIRP
ncbi:MAG: clan AA aspartic protease [Acidobacteria bacterium]|nr:clan AA aspartic protease [Acidobacteriota bacterium]